MIKSPRFRRRLALLAVVSALGIWAVVAIGRASRSHQSAAAPPQRSGAEQGTALAGVPRGLRLESAQGVPPIVRRNASLPRRIAQQPGAIPVRKQISELEDSRAAHETLRPDERGPAKMRSELHLGRGDVLKEREGTYAFGNSAYGATLGKGRVEFVRPITLKTQGQPRLSFDLVEIRSGSDVLVQGGEVDAKASLEERTISFDRGSVLERYSLRPDALEQSFVIGSLPAARGAVTVSGRISTNLAPPSDGTSGPTLSFTLQGCEVLTVSEAVAFDATGNRQELALAYAEGVVSMTVPADWVAQAILPITIDPLMGGPIVVDPSVSATIGQVNGVPVRVTDVAYNAQDNEWLVVWQEQFGASAFNFDVYAQRVNAAGNLVGAVIPVAVGGEGDYEPTVSWASGVNRYLVAWRQDPADDGSDADQLIAGRIINADGTFLTPSLAVDDVAGQDFGPSLAWDGTNWLCVFTNLAGASDTNVVGRFVATDGTPGAAVNVDTESDLAAAPAVDVTAGTYLVAWQKGPTAGPMSVVARTISATGALLTAITAVDQSASDCSVPDVSADGTQFLVVWQQTVSGADRNVVGRLVTNSLTFNGNVKNIRTSVADQLTPRAAFSATNSFWYVVYSDTTNGAADIYGNRVSTTGQIFGANRITNSTVDEARPELAWNSATSEMLTVYLYGSGSPYQIGGQRVSMDFSAPSVPGAPVATPNPSGTGTFTLSWNPTVETGGSGFSNYDLQRSANGGANWATIASPTTASYTDTLPQGEYVYRVRASDLAGNNSAYSAVSVGVMVDNAAPAEPLGPGQFRADGTTPVPVGGTTPESGVVLQASLHDLGLLDGFEDSNFTVDPMWTVSTGTWALATDGFKVLHDNAGLDDLIYTASTQSAGSWEYRFRWPTIATGATVNLQASFYPFLDSAGPGGNGYQVLISAGAASTKTVSLYRVDGASTTRLIGTNTNWTPNTSFHVVRVNRSAAGRFDLSFDGALLGSAVDATYGNAVSSLIRNVTTNGNTLRVDYVRMSSSAVARSTVKLQVEVKPVGTAFDGTGLVESVISASGSSASIPLSLANASYHWRARVVDGLGNGGPFAAFGGNAETEADFVVSYVPPPAAPAGLTAAPGNSQVSLQWSASSGATGYTVKRSLTAGGAYGIVAQNVPANSFVDGGLQNGTTYFYVVSATNSGGESSNSNEASATPVAPPASPTNLTAAPGNAQVSLAWTASAGATIYSVKRGTSSGGPYASVGTTAQISFVDGTVTNGMTYFYVVTAANAGGESGNSNQAAATPVAPPAAPTGLAAQAGNAQVFLTWNVTATATSYTLKRAATAGGPYAPVQTGLTATSATDSGLTNGATYYYVISAVNAGGEGGNSNEAPATPFAAPPAPTNLVATPGNTQVLLTWNSSPGAVSYGVKRGTAPGGPYSSITSGLTATTFMDGGLTNGTTYYYVVTATNAGGESPNSNETSATPAAPANAPTNLVATPGNAQILLTWSPVSDVTGYLIRRSVKLGGPYATVATSSGPAYTDPGLTNGVAYYYVVRSLIGASESGDSNEASARPTLGPPTPRNLRAFPGSGQVTLAWDSSSGAGSYSVKRSLTSGGPYAEVAGVVQSSYVDAPLSNGTAYYYVVTALNNGGESPPSEEVAAIPLATPVGLVAVADSRPSVSLTWSALVGANVVGYNVYRSSQAGGPYQRDNPAPIAEATYFDTNVQFGQTYYYVVRAVDAQNQESGNSNEASTKVANPPLGVFGFAFSLDSVDWSWYVLADQDPSWTSFELRDLNGNVITSTDPFTFEFVESGLAENTAYTRRIFARSDSGLTDPSDPAIAYTLVHNATPADFALSAGPTGGVTVTVVPPPHPTADATGVSIWRSSNGTSFQRIVVLVGSYAFTDLNVAPGATYFYAVQYRNGDAFSSVRSASRTVTTAPVPTALAGQAGSATSILWSWQGVPGATNYDLRDLQNNTVASTGNGNTSVLEQGLSENTLYSRVVRAYDAAALEGPSAPASRYTLVHNATPADFTLSAGGATSVVLSVTPPAGSSSGSTGCEISRSLNGNTWAVARAFSSAYSFTDGGLTGGTTYFYRIRFRNGDGVAGASSTAVSIQTPAGPPAAPPGFAGVALATSQIRWSWADVPGSSGFVVHNDAHQEIGSVAPGVLMFDEFGLSENARTSRHVHALQAGFPGPASSSSAVYTLVHAAVPADVQLRVFGRDRIDIVAVPPPSGLADLTAGEIQKLVGGSWVSLGGFSKAYAASDVGLSSGTTYSYRVRYQNGDGVAGDFSSVQTATTFNLPSPIITTPSKVTRSVTPSVRGTAAPGETLTISFGGVDDGTALADAAGNWFYVSTPKGLGSYTVVAYGSSSGYSNSITIQVVLSTLTPPAPPTNVRAKVYATVVDLEWDASVSPNVAGYQVYRSSESTGPWTLVNTTGVVLNTRYRDSGLVLGQTYHYRLTAVDNSVGD